MVAAKTACPGWTRPSRGGWHGEGMEHPKAIGDHTTLAVMLALQANSTPFFLPFGENTRCDVVIDEGWRLARVQCKTGRLRQGAVRFKVCSVYAHHPNPKATVAAVPEDVALLNDRA